MQRGAGKTAGWRHCAGLIAIKRPVCKSFGKDRRGAAGLAHGLDFNSLVKQPDVKQPNFQAANSQTNQKIIKAIFVLRTIKTTVRASQRDAPESLKETFHPLGPRKAQRACGMPGA